MKHHKSKRQNGSKNPQDYMDAIEAFLENEPCSPVEDVPLNPLCIKIAKRFNKTPEQVSKDINRAYLESWRPLPKTGGVYELDLLDPWED